jgi:hypothetical protein
MNLKVQILCSLRKQFTVEFPVIFNLALSYVETNRHCVALSMAVLSACSDLFSLI